jgi:hypothetical protein
MKPVTVPETDAGREVTCPSCGKPFDVPAKYTPTVLGESPPPAPNVPMKPPLPPEPPMSPDVPHDRPVPPPGFVPPVAPAPAPAPVPVPVSPPPLAPGPVSPSPDAPPPPLAAGYTHAHALTVSPRVVAWMPVVFFTLMLCCTFFPWVGTYLGGSAIVSQGPWRAMFGAQPNRNYELEKVTQTPPELINKIKSDWELLLPALFLLVVATLFAWGDRVLHDQPPRRIPPLAGVWPWRKTIVAVCGAVAFVLFVVQVSRGFGLERAIRQVVAEQFAGEREKVANKPAELAALEYAEEQAYAKFHLERTFWLYAGLAFNLIAVLAMAGHIALERRGAKPPPRIVIQY